MNRTEAQLPLSKRLLAAFFSLVLVVGLVPTSAWAEGEDLQNGDNQEQIGGGDTGDNTSGQNGDSEGTGEDPITDGDEGTGENGIQVANSNGGVEEAQGNEGNVATIDYTANPTQKQIYDTLVSTYGLENHKPKYFELTYIDGSGNSKTQNINKSSGSTVKAYEWGDYTCDISWDTGGRSGVGTLILREGYSITDPTVDYTYDGTPKEAWTPTVKATANPAGKTDKKAPQFTSDNFTITYYRGDVQTTDFTSAGTIRVNIKGKGYYSYIDEDKSYEIKKAEVTVGIEGSTDTVTYDGKSHTVEGYTATKTAGSELYDMANVKLVNEGSDKATGTDAELYPMGLSDNSFENTDANFDVKFEVEDGGLQISQAKVTVYIKGCNNTVVYNGDQQSVSDFRVSQRRGESYKLYKKDYISLVGDKKAEAVGTDAGTYEMGLTDESFQNNNNNFDVTFKVTDDGWLKIDPAKVNVTVKGNSDTVTYNGKEKHVTGFTATADSDLYNVGNVVPNAGVNTIAKGTAAGTYEMGLTADSFYNTDDNFNVTWGSVEDGVLTIKAADVTVNVKGNTKTVTYNGEKQQVTGFTATTDSDLYDTSNVVLNPDFSDIAVGTDAATYMMGLGADSFYNADDNFNVNWNFQGDGGITIEKRAIQVSDSASVVYNGQEQVLNFTASKVTGLVDGDRLNLFGAQVKGTEPGTYTDVTVDRWEVVNDELNVTNNYDLTLNGELTITKADDSAGNNGGSSADNGTKASGSDNGSTTTKTADTALPFGVAFAAAAAALAALVATRKLRSMR